MNQLCNDMKMMKEKVMMMNKDCCEMLSCADPNNICNNMELMEMMCSFETMSNEMKMNM